MPKPTLKPGTRFPMDGCTVRILSIVRLSRRSDAPAAPEYRYECLMLDPKYRVRQLLVPEVENAYTAFLEESFDATIEAAAIADASKAAAAASEVQR